MQKEVKAVGVAIEVPLTTLRRVKEVLEERKQGVVTTDDCLHVVGNYLDFVLRCNSRYAYTYSLLNWLKNEPTSEEGSSCPPNKQISTKLKPE